MKDLSWVLPLLQVRLKSATENLLNGIPENGGTNPVYAWYVNTVEVPGETSDTYAYQPADDDVVTLY